MGWTEPLSLISIVKVLKTSINLILDNSMITGKRIIFGYGENYGNDM